MFWGLLQRVAGGLGGFGEGVFGSGRAAKGEGDTCCGRMTRGWVRVTTEGDGDPGLRQNDENMNGNVP